MASFGQIKARVQTRLIDLPAATVSEIPILINEAMRAAQDFHNFRAMESSVTFTTANATRTLGSKPGDWKERRTANPYTLDGQTGEDGNTEIRWLADEIEAVRLYGLQDPDDNGAPRHLLEKESILEVYPYPDTESEWDDGNYRVAVPYWAYLAALSADGDTNWFTANLDAFLVEKAAADAFALNWDETRSQFYEARALPLLQRAIRVDKRSRLGRGLVLAPHRDVFATRFQHRGS